MLTSVGSATMTEFARNSRVYVDTNVIIHWVERREPYTAQIQAVIRSINEATAQLVTSQLAVAECLFLPARNDNATLITMYDRFFASDPELEVTTIDGELVIEAARLGGKLGLKLLDSVHFVAARTSKCAYFLTGDSRFRSAYGITVCRLDAWSPSA